MKMKKSRIEMAREIIASLKKGMAKSRPTASAHNALEDEPALTGEEPMGASARA